MGVSRQGAATVDLAFSMKQVLSAGLACSPHDALDVSGLMRAADLRLRAAKKLGRNRIVARDSH